MINDSISDLFTRIRNACFLRQEKVIVPYNRSNRSLLNILAKHGFIVHFKRLTPSTLPQLVVTLKYKKNQPIIRQLKRISRPSCRIYVNARNIPQSYGNIVFLSTSKGILNDREAKNLKIGGEILGFVA